MNSKLVVKLSLIALAVGIIAGCGGGHSSSSSSDNNMNLDTQKVLAQAQNPSETANPYSAADGAVTITDTSEMTDPITVNNP